MKKISVATAADELFPTLPEGGTFQAPTADGIVPAAPAAGNSLVNAALRPCRETSLTEVVEGLQRTTEIDARLLLARPATACPSFSDAPRTHERGSIGEVLGRGVVDLAEGFAVVGILRRLVGMVG